MELTCLLFALSTGCDITSVTKTEDEEVLLTLLGLHKGCNSVSGNSGALVSNIYVNGLHRIYYLCSLQNFTFSLREGPPGMTLTFEIIDFVL